MIAKLCLLLFLVIIIHEATEVNATKNKTTTVAKVALRSLGKRYTVFKQRLSWPQALLFCRRRKRQLATVMDEDDHQAIRNEIKRLAKMWNVALSNFWIGGGMEGSNWVWATTGKQLQYVIWSKGQPKPLNLCLQLNSKDDFKFVSAKCEALSMFVCQG